MLFDMLGKTKKDLEEKEPKNNSIEEDKTDTDILVESKKKMSSSVETQEYDNLPEFDSSEKIEDELSKKDSIFLEYSFNGDEVTEGLTLYQASTILKKNLIYSAILIAVFFIYMVNIIKNPTETFSIFLAAMCVAVLGFIWILPKLHIKKTAKAADLQEFKFSMNIYNDCIKIGDNGGSFVIYFNKEISQIYETSNLYLVCAGKERLFILPKRCLNQENEEKIKSIFKSAMQDKYIIK